MHCQKKECLILRHELLPAMPFDITKDLHHSYGRDIEVRKIIENWVNRLGYRQVKMDDIDTEDSDSFEHVRDGNRSAIRVENKRLHASGLTWRVLKGDHQWKFSWRITVQNRSRGLTGFSVEVSFLDKHGYSIDNQLAIFKTPLEPLANGELKKFKLMSVDLAKQVASISATVDVWGSS